MSEWFSVRLQSRYCRAVPRWTQYGKDLELGIVEFGDLEKVGFVNWGFLEVGDFLDFILDLWADAVRWLQNRFAMVGNEQPYF